MRNSDYIIRITTKRGRAWSYRKENDGWTQTAPTGVIRRMTAEQLLSHLLPALAKDQPHLNVTVEPKTPAPVIPTAPPVIPTAVEESLTLSASQPPAPKKR